MTPKANELRIGNLLRYTADDIIKPELRGTIFYVIPDDILFLSENINCDWIESVEITNKFLTDNADNYTFYHDGCIIYSFGIIKIWQQGENIWIDSPIRIDDIKYVHQIQNLYHSIKLKELIINL